MALNFAQSLQKLGFSAQSLPVLLVALLTWSGVFVYLMRLEFLVHALEDKEKHHDARELGAVAND